MSWEENKASGAPETCRINIFAAVINTVIIVCSVQGTSVIVCYLQAKATAYEWRI
jgi:hypothetical protein